MWFSFYKNNQGHDLILTMELVKLYFVGQGVAESLTMSRFPDVHLGNICIM